MRSVRHATYLFETWHRPTLEGLIVSLVKIIVITIAVILSILLLGRFFF
jgi:hypothetical protein